MPLKINNINITNPITSFSRKQREEVEFSFVDGVSPISKVVLKILKMPVSINNPTFNIKWDGTSNDTVEIDTIITTSLHLILDGTYQIEATEEYTSGVIRKRMIIIEAVSLNNNLGIPFPGESTETNSSEGWARKVEKSIQELSQSKGALSVIGRHSAIEHAKKSVVMLSDVISTDNSGFFYEILSPSEIISPSAVKQLGIVIEKWVTGSSEEFNPSMIYKVALSGPFYVGSAFLPWTGDVYYNSTSNELTNDSADRYVGQYINNILYIESPIFIGGEHNALSGRDENEAHPGTAVSIDNSGLSGFLGGVEDVQELAQEINDAVGNPNGIASLDGDGRLPFGQLPISAMEYKGTWNADTNTPTLADGTGTNGDVYLCNVAGTQDLGSGAISFAEGDWAVYNGTIWQKSPHQGDIHDNTMHTTNLVGEPGVINAMDEKLTLADGDAFIIEDVDDTNNPKKIYPPTIFNSINDGWKVQPIPLSSILITGTNSFDITDMKDGFPILNSVQELPHLFDDYTDPIRTQIFGGFNIYTKERDGAIYEGIFAVVYININEDIIDISTIKAVLELTVALPGGTFSIDGTNQIQAEIACFTNATGMPATIGDKDVNTVHFNPITHGLIQKHTFEFNLDTLPSKLNIGYIVVSLNEVYSDIECEKLTILGGRFRYKVNTSNLKNDVISS